MANSKNELPEEIKKKLTMTMTYLYAGSFRTGSNGKPQIIPGTVEPIKHQWIAGSLDLLDESTNDKNVQSNLNQKQTNASDKTKYTLYYCDGKGLIHTYEGKIDVKMPLRISKNSHQMHFIPRSLSKIARVGEGTNFYKPLIDFFGSKSMTSETLEEIHLIKSDLRKPREEERTSDPNEAHDFYANFYESLGAKKTFKSIVLAKSKALIFIFSSDYLKGAQLTAKNPDGQNIFEDPVYIQSDKDTGIVYCAACENDTKAGVIAPLKQGIYTIQVRFKSLPDSHRWSQKVQQDKSYTIREMVHFSIKNHAGEFEIINCDPISLEEVIFTQHAEFYAHLLAPFNKQNELFLETTGQETSESLAKNESPESSVAKPLKDFVDRLVQSRDKIKYATGVLSSDTRSGFLWKTGKLLSTAYANAGFADTEYGKIVQSTINYVFAVKDGYDKYKSWGELVEKISKVRKSTSSHLITQFAKDANVATIGYLKEIQISASIDNLSLELVETVEKSPDRARMFSIEDTTSAVKTFGIALTVLDWANKTYSLANAWEEFSGAKEALTKNLVDYHKILSKYNNKFGAYPYRAALAIIEKFRTATLTSQMGFSEKDSAMTMAAFDATMAILSVVPMVGVYAGALVLAKESASAAVGIVSSYIDLLDKCVFGQIISKLKNKMDDKSKKLESFMSINERLLFSSSAADPIAHNLDIQHRIRAQAVSGIVELINMADERAESDDQFRKIIEGIKLDKYIEERVLADGWELIESHGSVTGCGDQWIYPRQGSTSDMRRHLAQFHQHFPIHRMESKTAVDLATLFRIQFGKQLNKDSIICTCIYKKPKESNGKWKLISPDDILSAFDEVRILIVLDESIKTGSLDTLIKLFRCDFFDSVRTESDMRSFERKATELPGPEYKIVTSKLTENDLLEEEKHFKGRLGCVFKPYYNLGKRIYGIRPLVKGILISHLDIKNYQKLGGFTKMKYYFEVTIANENTRQAIKLTNGLPKSPNCDKTEICMSIGNSPEEQKLLGRTFIRSRDISSPYPRLFWDDSSNRREKDKVYAQTCYFRIGGSGPYQLRSLPPNYKNMLEYKGMKPYSIPMIHKFDDFDWSKPVEMVLVMWGKVINKQEYVNSGLPWNQIPAEMVLENLDGTKGPTYNSDFHWIGNIKWPSTEPGPDGNSDGEVIRSKDLEMNKLGPLGQWVNQVFGNAEEKKFLFYALGVEKAWPNLPSEGNFYAAYFKLDYRLDGQANFTSSLRPFGKEIVHSEVNKNNYYRYRILSIKSPNDVGLNESLPFQFHFRAPTAQEEKSTPWSLLTEKAKKDWIVTHADTRDCELMIN